MPQFDEFSIHDDGITRDGEQIPDNAVGPEVGKPATEQCLCVVELDAAIEHPDLASDRAALERVRAKRAAKR